jgi:hypothetical protein
MFKVSSDIYFVVYNLYYVGQNGDLGTRARPINRDGGSIVLCYQLCYSYYELFYHALDSFLYILMHGFWTSDDLRLVNV